MLARSGNAGRHPVADRGPDLYETPEVAVRALLAAENIPPVVWEPACGRGAIARPLVAAGHTVYASDLHDHGFGLTGIDFLAATKAPDGCGAIMTNPPYKHATEFAERAVKLVPKVVMLLRLAFLESERRSQLLEYSGLCRVHVFRNRLPMMHRDGWQGPTNVSATAFAWFVWRRDFHWEPVIKRISWE